VPVTVKRILLWRKEVENRTGVLAETLEPFAKAKANLQVVMGYRYPGTENKCAVEVYPVQQIDCLCSRGGLDCFIHSNVAC
jgi:hypothetical protein